MDGATNAPQMTTIAAARLLRSISLGQVDIDGAALMRQLVLGNQIVIGSVNASRKHFELAVADLDKAMKLANSPLQRIITHRFSYTRFDEALFHHAADEIKAVVEWA